MRKNLKKFVHDGFSLEQAGKQDDNKARELFWLFMAVTHPKHIENYDKQAGQCEPDWEDLVFAAACGHESGVKPLREKKMWVNASRLERLRGEGCPFPELLAEKRRESERKTEALKATGGTKTERSIGPSTTRSYMSDGLWIRKS